MEMARARSAEMENDDIGKGLEGWPWWRNGEMRQVSGWQRCAKLVLAMLASGAAPGPTHSSLGSGSKVWSSKRGVRLMVYHTKCI